VPCAVNCCDVTESSVKLETKSLKLNERGRLLVSEFCSTVKVKDQNKQTIFESCMMIQENGLSLFVLSLRITDSRASLVIGAANRPNRARLGLADAKVCACNFLLVINSNFGRMSYRKQKTNGFNYFAKFVTRWKTLVLSVTYSFEPLITALSSHQLCACFRH